MITDSTDRLFDQKIVQQMEKFKTKSFQKLEKETAEKRMSWFNQNFPNPSPCQNPSPRQAFELLFFKYMGLNPDDLPVISETKNEIVWQSLNPCPTLEACVKMGLHTRQVCRSVYEKSTQALVSLLDPQLRFLRSYENIRPYASDCREWIVRVDFQTMLALASSDEDGQTMNGSGAVVSLGNRIVAKVIDLPSLQEGYSTCMIENAIDQAQKTLGNLDLSGTILFLTRQPNPSCFNLIVQSNLSAMVIRDPVQKGSAAPVSDGLVFLDEIPDRPSGMIEIYHFPAKEK